jgi:L,D-transpeptidase catalytic domain
MQASTIERTNGPSSCTARRMSAASSFGKRGRLGRSWGCPALRDGVAREVIDRVRGNGILFAYYPNQDWLGSSKYLGDCAAADLSS